MEISPMIQFQKVKVQNCNSLVKHVEIPLGSPMEPEVLFKRTFAARGLKTLAKWFGAVI